MVVFPFCALCDSDNLLGDSRLWSQGPSTLPLSQVQISSIFLYMPETQQQAVHSDCFAHLLAVCVNKVLWGCVIWIVLNLLTVSSQFNHWFPLEHILW